MIHQTQHFWVGRYHDGNPRPPETAHRATERVIVFCLAGMCIPRDSNNNAAASSSHLASFRESRSKICSLQLSTKPVIWSRTWQTDVKAVLLTPLSCPGPRLINPSRAGTISLSFQTSWQIRLLEGRPWTLRFNLNSNPNIRCDGTPICNITDSYSYPTALVQGDRHQLPSWSHQKQKAKKLGRAPSAQWRRTIRSWRSWAVRHMSCTC
jgi:hypothetical protein